ncbi:unannotated protein [freshwater metagenome]|uniref:Unannotated protein n=1 Tax=freshwater metagenome TaxID=449393 RepID=A0A6J6QM61_9ZZZZ
MGDHRRRRDRPTALPQVAGPARRGHDLRELPGRQEGRQAQGRQLRRQRAVAGRLPRPHRHGRPARHHAARQQRGRRQGLDGAARRRRPVQPHDLADRRVRLRVQRRLGHQQRRHRIVRRGRRRGLGQPLLPPQPDPRRVLRVRLHRVGRQLPAGQQRGRRHAGSRRRPDHRWRPVRRAQPHLGRARPGPQQRQHADPARRHPGLHQHVPVGVRRRRFRGRGPRRRLRLHDHPARVQPRPVQPLRRRRRPGLARHRPVRRDG